MIELSTGKCLAMPVKLRLAIGIYIYRYSGIFDIQKGAAQLTTTGTPVPTYIPPPDVAIGGYS